jgi:hypothetical protein
LLNNTQVLVTRQTPLMRAAEQGAGKAESIPTVVSNAELAAHGLMRRKHYVHMTPTLDSAQSVLDIMRKRK